MYRYYTVYTASVRNYLIITDNTIYTFSIKFSFSSIEQERLTLQKQITKLLMSNIVIYSDGKLSYFVCVLDVIV